MKKLTKLILCSALVGNNAMAQVLVPSIPNPPGSPPGYVPGAPVNATVDVSVHFNQNQEHKGSSGNVAVIGIAILVLGSILLYNMNQPKAVFTMPKRSNANETYSHEDVKKP